MTLSDLVHELAIGPMRRIDGACSANGFTTKWQRYGAGGNEFPGSLVVRAIGQKLARFALSDDRPTVLEITAEGRAWLVSSRPEAA